MIKWEFDSKNKKMIWFNYLCYHGRSLLDGSFAPFNHGVQHSCPSSFFWQCSRYEVSRSGWLFRAIYSGLSISGVGKRGEERCSHSRNTLLEGHTQAVIKFLGANNAVLLGIHNEASEAWVSRVLSIEFGKEVLIIDSDDTWDITLAFESSYLAQHSLLVNRDSFINDTWQGLHITLPASKSHLWFNQFDQALNKKVLEEGGVLISVLHKALSHLETSFILKTFDQFISSLHAIDTRFICCLRFLNLEVAFCDLQVLQHLIIKTLLFGLNHLFWLHGEVRLHLLLDLVNSLATLRANELDHTVHDELWLLVVHFWYRVFQSI